MRRARLPCLAGSWSGPFFTGDQLAVFLNKKGRAEARPSHKEETNDNVQQDKLNLYPT